MKKINGFPVRIQKMYKRYFVKFWFRIIILAAVIIILMIRPEETEVLEGMKFFQHFSVLHILWMLWLWYMLEKLLPLKNWKPKGCMKYRKTEFQPSSDYESWAKSLQEGTKAIEEEPEEKQRNKGKERVEGEKHRKNQEFYQAYKKQRKWYNKGALIVLICWLLVAIIISILRYLDILSNPLLLIGSCLFYIGDVVCILFWCPFREVLMKNRCCTQCRIYNWDTMMLILPIVFIPGFYSYSLFLLALINVGIWEITGLVHPERYCPISNANLQCMNCKGELGCARLQNKYNSKTGRSIR